MLTQTMAYIDANKERYLTDMKRKEIAQRLGTSVDNIEYRNGIYYVCTRSVGGVITHKYEVAEGIA